MRNVQGINHFITITTISSFLGESLGIDPRQPIKLVDWLTFPQQRLLEITSGKIYRDDLKIKELIERFRYYPRDLWLYMMASQWQKIAEEEAFVARTAAVGDELGSMILAARIVKELMDLSFLMEKKYAPYSKWFGTLFSKLEIAGKLEPVLLRVLQSNSIHLREKWLSEAYRTVAQKHNSLKITGKVSTRASRYYNRPYLVLHADRFAREIRKKISDETIRNLPLIGSIDQVSDNPVLLMNQKTLAKMRVLYV